jgi:hypothetical protein
VGVTGNRQYWFFSQIFQAICDVDGNKRFLPARIAPGVSAQMMIRAKFASMALQCNGCRRQQQNMIAH